MKPCNCKSMDDIFGSYNVISAELEDVSQPFNLADGTIRSEIPNAKSMEDERYVISEQE